MKSIEKIGVKGYAFKNYVCQELSFAEFSGQAVLRGRRTRRFRRHPLVNPASYKVLCSYFPERKGRVPRVSFYERYSTSFAHGTYHV